MPQYSDKMIEYFNNPRNVGAMDQDDPDVGTGVVGSPVCGDVLKFQIRVAQDGTITDAKFKTFGCGSAIAASSLATEWLKGRTIEQAGEIKNMEIAKELELPDVKIHCSVLAEEAIQAAIDDWKRKHLPPADDETAPQ
ncbi:MAG: Fe-S cluster assembly scaffold IscU [Phycisphaerae bacterium]|nr:Fe-S cluster assembly scaffold IscU [Phycisphaerae bacterium]